MQLLTNEFSRRSIVRLSPLIGPFCLLPGDLRRLSGTRVLSYLISLNTVNLLRAGAVRRESDCLMEPHPSYLQ